MQTIARDDWDIGGFHVSVLKASESAEELSVLVAVLGVEVSGMSWGGVSQEAIRGCLS